ncbi:hypothetical protein NED98_05665 [Sphingomonas sp. MMSM20]|uniref:hypothetical protein n=1 Tax=Sphingomonas lycopersici TaxID=2951807 RepID=UPI0022371FCA|nr:hypothetical protein [Sphingomonas lycopersici]MCW6529727.1 hypothetical protein [Sphingomonas lycopersici]
MRTSITDPAALRSITPAALVAYALSEGWTKAESFGDHSDVYQRPNSPELILPGTDSLGDYPAVVSSILSILSGEEGRDELQLFRDLVGADRDVIRVRAPEADDDGSVSIDAGVELVLQARDMLLAAACAAKDPRAAYRAGKVKDAASYMDRVRLGQTEQGSFIVTLLAPVPPALDLLDQGTFWPVETEEPFDRKVTRTLAKALDASRRAAESAVRGNGMAAFQEAVSSGVNANLCDALATLIDKGNGLEVSVTWARTRPTPEKRKVVRFSESEGEIFREAASRFRTLEPRPDETLNAFVVALDRQPDAGEGKVSLKTFLDGQPVSVRATLPPDMYHRALGAHDTKQSVVLTGDLKRAGQRWVLENPRNLQIIQDDEANE